MLQGPHVDSLPGSLANSKEEVLTTIPKTNQHLEGHVKTILDETKTVRSCKSVIAYLLLFGFLIFAGFVVAGNASSLPTENLSCTFRNKTQPSVEAQTVSQWTTQWSILKERLTPHPWQMLSTRMVKHNEHGATLTVWLFSVFDHLYSNVANLRKYFTQHLSPLWGRMTAQLSFTHHFSPLWERMTVQATDVWHSLCSCINKYGWVMDNALSYLIGSVLFACLVMLDSWHKKRIVVFKHVYRCSTPDNSPYNSEDEGEPMKIPQDDVDESITNSPMETSMHMDKHFILVSCVKWALVFLMVLLWTTSVAPNQSSSVAPNTSRLELHNETAFGTPPNQSSSVAPNTSRLELHNETAFGTPPNQSSSVVHNSTTSFPAPKTEMDIHWLMDVLQRETMLEEYIEKAETYLKELF